MHIKLARNLIKVFPSPDIWALEFNQCFFTNWHATCLTAKHPWPSLCHCHLNNSQSLEIWIWIKFQLFKYFIMTLIRIYMYILTVYNMLLITWLSKRSLLLIIQEDFDLEVFLKLRNWTYSLNQDNKHKGKTIQLFQVVQKFVQE